MDKAAGVACAHGAVACPGLLCNVPETDSWENKYFISDMRNWASSSQVTNTRGTERAEVQPVSPFSQRTLVPRQQAFPSSACTPEGASPQRIRAGLVQPGCFTREPGNTKMGETVL